MGRVPGYRPGRPLLHKVSLHRGCRVSEKSGVRRTSVQMASAEYRVRLTKVITFIPFDDASFASIDSELTTLGRTLTDQAISAILGA